MQGIPYKEHVMLTYRIEDMTCGHCASAIARAVRATDAHARLQVDVHEKLIHIQPGDADEEELVAAISDAGYHPIPVAVAEQDRAPARTTGCCCGSGEQASAAAGIVRPGAQGQTDACGAVGG